MAVSLPDVPSPREQWLAGVGVVIFSAPSRPPLQAGARSSGGGGVTPVPPAIVIVGPPAIHPTRSFL